MGPWRLVQLLVGVVVVAAVAVPQSVHAVAHKPAIDSSGEKLETGHGAKSPALADKKGKKEKKRKWRDGELMVKYKAGVAAEATKSAHAKLGATKRKEFTHLRLHHVQLKTGITVEQAVQEYQKDPNVEYAEPNYIYTAEALPGDSRFGELWGMHNTGQTGGTPGADIKASEAWNITTGSNQVVVAVIDTGIDYNHQDLVANLWHNPGEVAGNLIDDDGNGIVDDIYGLDTYNHDSWPFDDNGHGTHVAGTIGAVGNNALGVAGINWRVQILSCKFLDASGTGDTSGAVECLEYIRKLKAKGVNIVATSNSWGGGDYSQALYDAINAQRDILFIAAAGNDGVDITSTGWIHYPSDYDLPNVISVAATDHNDKKAIFSNYGRRNVDLSAPGVKILSTLPAVNEWGIAGGYGLLSGTSMATPHVTGVAALLKAQNPNCNWVAIKNLLLSGGDDAANMHQRTVTGKRLNAYGSLTCSNQPVFSALTLPSALTAGTPVTVSALSIDCDNPVGPVVLRTSTGDVITLADDGLGADLAASDGIFTGTWTPTGSKAILLFSSPAGQDTVEYPPFVINGFVDNAALNASYSATLQVSDGYPPFAWSIPLGSLPPGMTLNPATGEIAGSSGQPGIYSFTLLASDVYGAKALKDLSMTVYPAGIAKSWESLIDTNGWINIYYDYYVGKVVDVAVDTQGNSYVTRFGWDLDVQNNAMQEVYFLVKYDSQGNILWTNKNVPGKPAAVTVDANGSVYVAGLSVTLNGNQGAYDHYQLAKYDPQGGLVWIRKNPATMVNDVVADHSGNVYLTADFQVVKYDGDGNQLWSRPGIGGNLPFLAVDLQGNLYVADFAGPMDDFDVSLMKYNPTGNLLWWKAYDNGGRETAQDVTVDSNGDVYVTGWTLGSPSTLFVMKLNSEGILQWNRSFPADYGSKGFGLAVGDGGVYVTGSYQGSSYSGIDYLVLKYDAAGNRLWAVTLDNGGEERGERLVVDPEGNMIITGNGADWTAALTYKLNDATTLAITTAQLPDGAAGTAYSAALAAKGGTGTYTWSVAPDSLPSGLAIDPATGEISGTPSGRWNGVVEVTITDESGKIAMRRLQLQIMGIDDTTIHPVVSGVPYDLIVTGGGGSGGYTWTVASGSLPTGLALQNPVDGSVHIKGNSTETGTSRFTVSLEDSAGKKAFKDITMSVVAPSCAASPVRIVRTPLLYFDTIQAAADAAVDGEILQLQDVDTYGDVTVNRGIPLVIRGGYGCFFNNNPAYTTVHGSLLVANGTIEIDHLIIAP